MYYPNHEYSLYDENFVVQECNQASQHESRIPPGYRVRPRVLPECRLEPQVHRPPRGYQWRTFPEPYQQWPPIQEPRAPEQYPPAERELASTSHITLLLGELLAGQQEQKDLLQKKDEEILSITQILQGLTTQIQELSSTQARLRDQLAQQDEVASIYFDDEGFELPQSSDEEALHEEPELIIEDTPLVPTEDMEEYLDLSEDLPHTIEDLRTKEEEMEHDTPEFLLEDVPKSVPDAPFFDAFLLPHFKPLNPFSEYMVQDPGRLSRRTEFFLSPAEEHPMKEGRPDLQALIKMGGRAFTWDFKVD